LHFPKTTLPRPERFARVFSLRRTVRGDLAAIPKVGLFGIEKLLRRGHENAIGGLALAALIRLKHPTETWLRGVDSQRIDEVFATQLAHGHLRFGASGRGRKETAQYYRKETIFHGIDFIGDYSKE
jgi:hypothetical protein